MDFDLTKFRSEFLQKKDGWHVSDCYKPYDDKFIRRDAQDAYEGAKWAWDVQQEKIDAVLSVCLEYWCDDDRDYNIYIQKIEELLK